MPNIRFIRRSMEHQKPLKHQIPEYTLRVCDPVKHESEYGPYITYTITMHTTSAAFRLRRSRTQRRYSEFDWLRKQLDKMDNWNSPPPLPPKRLWGSMEAKNIESRRQGLEDWLKEIVSDAQYLSYTGLHVFLQTEMTLEQIQDYLKGDLPENQMEKIWKNNGRLYDFQAHNILHNCFHEEPIEIQYSPEDHRPPLSRSLYSDRPGDKPLALENRPPRPLTTRPEDLGKIVTSSDCYPKLSEITRGSTDVTSHAASEQEVTSQGPADREPDGRSEPLPTSDSVPGWAALTDQDSGTAGAATYDDGPKEPGAPACNGQPGDDHVADGDDYGSCHPSCSGGDSYGQPYRTRTAGDSYGQPYRARTAGDRSVDKPLVASVVKDLPASADPRLTEVQAADAVSSSTAESSLTMSTPTSIKTKTTTGSAPISEVARDDYSINGD